MMLFLASPANPLADQLTTSHRRKTSIALYAAFKIKPPFCRMRLKPGLNRSSTMVCGRFVLPRRVPVLPGRNSRNIGANQILAVIRFDEYTILPIISKEHVTHIYRVERSLFRSMQGVDIDRSRACPVRLFSKIKLGVCRSAGDGRWFCIAWRNSLACKGVASQ